MNAIINLNHFCEIHGPQTIFSTQTVRQIETEKGFYNNSSGSSNTNCYGCGSIGSSTIYMTRMEKDSSIIFASSEKSIIGKDNQNALITLRSLSCEITANNQEGLVFFGDSRTNSNSCLHSLCFTFKVKDSLARGFEKLYSIVIIMKDKMFLLNTQPFLSSNIKEVARQIQESAQKIYEIEQKQFPQRAERLNTGKASNVPPRSLKELTGESNVFAHLHANFSWILMAGSRYYSEIITLGTLSIPAMSKDIEEGFAFIQIDKEDFLMQTFPSSSHSYGDETSYDLRTLKKMTGSSFTQVLYYSLAGIQIVIRGERQQTREFSRYFKDYLPTQLHRFIIESNKYVPSTKCKILCLPPDAIVPPHNVCRIEFKNAEQIDPSVIKCPIDLPSRLPQLLVKTLNAIDEKLFTNVILEKFVKALVEEWKNKVICLSHQHDDLTKLKRTIGVQSHDDVLVSYWLGAF